MVTLLNEETYSDKDMIMKLLDELKRRNPDILSVILTNREGLEIASDIGSGEDALLLSAMIASLYAMGEKTVAQMKRGPFSKLIVSGENGSILILGEPQHDIVIGLTLREKANLGLALIETKRILSRVIDLLK